MATGDALGAGYEFGPTLPPDAPVGMVGGGSFGWSPGEWTDDTSMAIPILRALAAGADLLEPRTQDVIARAWVDWTSQAKDVGVHTATILRSASAPVTAAELTAAAAARFAAGHNSAGNGTLMRTTPIALGYLHDPAGLTAASRFYALLTHGDPQGADACVLWNHAQRHAILTGELDIRVGLEHLSAEAAQVWAERIDIAESGSPAGFARGNGWVVRAFQAAWSAIATTSVPAGPFAAEHLRQALLRAVRAGHDTDTVAAITGGLLGAAWGVSAIPSTWRRLLHGWPDLTGADLWRLSILAANGGACDGQGWPNVPRLYGSGEPLVVRHPHDDGLWIGDVYGLDALPEEVDAVVSLCRLGSEQPGAGQVAARDHVEIWLIDAADPGENPHLELALADAVAVTRQLRAEGKTVFLHCVHAHSRTPTVAALYSVEAFGVDPADALAQVCAVIPEASPNRTFEQVLRGWQRLGATSRG
jgi:ADP-ribosylglycohydrolase